jgi:hypothetical protein
VASPADNVQRSDAGGKDSLAVMFSTTMLTQKG